MFRNLPRGHLLSSSVTRALHSRLLLRHASTKPAETPQTSVTPLEQPQKPTDSSEPQKPTDSSEPQKAQDPSEPDPPKIIHFHPDTPAPLKEFFPADLKLFRDGMHYGRGWLVDELRLKSNLDLHRLWYVLLKEKNLLLTMENEARALKLMIKKGSRKVYVVQSMSHLKQVLVEREQVILGAMQLQEESKDEVKPAELPKPDPTLFEKILIFFKLKQT